MKIKSLISLTLLFTFGLTAKAEDNLTKLIVWVKDGSQVAYALEEKPNITFTETDMVITTQGIEVNFTLDEMDRITYEISGESAVRGLKTDDIKLKFDGETLLFPSLSEKSKVSIISASGKLVFEKTVQTAGEYYFPVSALESGTYLVTVNGFTYKIMKK